MLYNNVIFIICLNQYSLVTFHNVCLSKAPEFTARDNAPMSKSGSGNYTLSKEI